MEHIINVTFVTKDEKYNLTVKAISFHLVHLTVRVKFDSYREIPVEVYDALIVEDHERKRKTGNNQECINKVIFIY